MKDSSDSIAPATGPGPDSANGPRLILGFASGSWRNAGREGAWVFAGQALMAVAGLAGVRILTELATAEVVGRASLLLGIFAIARNVFLGPVGNAQLRFHPEYVDRNQARGFAREIAGMTFASGVALAVALVIGLAVWHAIDAREGLAVLFGLVLWMSLVESAKTLLANRLSAERRRGFSALWGTAEAWLLVLCTAAALKWSATSASYVAGQAMGITLAFLGFGVLLFPRDRSSGGELQPAERARLRREVLAYGLPLLPFAVVAWVSSLGDRYVLGASLGAADVGIYAATYGLASRPFMVVGSVITVYARPILFQAEGQRNPAKAKRVFALWIALTAAISAAGVIAFLVLGGLVARVFLAPHFRRPETARLFLWISISYAFVNLTQVMENRLLSLGRSGRLLLPAAVGAATSLALNLFLIPRFGISGAAHAAALAFFAQFLLASAMCFGARDPRGAGTGK